MEINDFVDSCVDQGYEWVKENLEGKDGYIIGCRRLDTAAHFSVEAIQNNLWADLEKQITQGKNVHHISRVVGYYSRIQNWNKSKKGELKDRHKGNYLI